METEEDSDDIIIRISRSGKIKSQSASHSDTAQNMPNKSQVLRRTGINVVTGLRNSDYGLTEIQSLAAGDRAQRVKILALIRNPALYDYVPAILDYLFNMGRSTDAERRYFAALAVVELTSVLPFSELKDGVISQWAKHKNGAVNRTAAIALARVVNDERSRANVLTLLKHWVDTRNQNLTSTALMTYFDILLAFPKETLESVRKIVTNEYSLAFVPKVMALTERLYRKQPLVVISTLYEWFSQRQSTELCVFSALTFTSIANISDFAADPSASEKALDFAYRLWEDSSIPQQPKLQELIGETLRDWAITTVSLQQQDLTRAECVAWFHALGRKCAAKRQNRLAYYLQRWQKMEDVRLARLERYGRSQSTFTRPVNFSELMPPP